MSAAAEPGTRTARRARLRRRARWVALALGVVAAFAIGEVVARAYGPTGAYESLYLPDPHPEIGYRLDPAHSEVNAHGMRDVEREVARVPGRARVVLLGDSFAYGRTAREENFPSLLDELLGPGVEVINSGVPGWSTRSQVAWLERDGLAWEPDALVLAFFVGNDVGENEVGVVTGVDDGGNLVDGERHGFFKRFYRQSHLYRLIRRLPHAVECLFTGEPYQQKRYYKIEQRRMAICREEAHAEGWEQTRAALARLRELAGERPVVMLVIPDEFQVDAALRAEALEEREDPGTGYDWELPQRRLAALADELGFVRVDVLDAMRARTEEGERLYLPLDSHWNAAGNRLAAERLAEVEALRALAE